MTPSFVLRPGVVAPRPPELVRELDELLELLVGQAAHHGGEPHLLGTAVGDLHDPRQHHAEEGHAEEHQDAHHHARARLTPWRQIAVADGRECHHALGTTGRPRAGNRVKNDPSHIVGEVIFGVIIYGGKLLDQLKTSHSPPIQNGPSTELWPMVGVRS